MSEGKSRRRESGPKLPGAGQFKVCRLCGKRKSALSFDKELNACIKCKYKPTEPKTGGKKQRRKGTGTPIPDRVRRRKCPVCLTITDAKLVLDEWIIQEHARPRVENDETCSGSGSVLYRVREDALDFRATGSFESGRRR